jgi:NAD(P)H-dependent FMN reductase
LKQPGSDSAAAWHDFAALTGGARDSTTMSKILAFSGSARRDSFNQKLATAAASAVEAAGGGVTLINLVDYPMPLYNQDDEAENGLPATVVELKALCADHDGLLIAAPEYNGSITPLLKNTLDWLSRRGDDDAPLVPYQNKVAAIMAASAGRLGGLRGLVHVRAILGNLGVLVLPKQHALSAADKAFSDDGALRNEHDRDAVASIAASLVDACDKLKG